MDSLEEIYRRAAPSVADSTSVESVPFIGSPVTTSSVGTSDSEECGRLKEEQSVPTAKLVHSSLGRHQLTQEGPSSDQSKCLIVYLKIWTSECHVFFSLSLF
jgi:hypothetical protein